MVEKREFVVIFKTEKSSDGSQIFTPLEVVEGKYVVTVTVPAEVVAEYIGEMGIDVIWGADLGVTQLSGQYLSVYGEYEAAE